MQTILTLASQAPEPLIDLAVAIMSFFKHLAISTFNFVIPLITGCPQPVDDRCFEPGLRSFDFLTPMADARTIAAVMSKFPRIICAGAAGPSDILIYPLLDINLAKGVHAIGNAILYLLVQMPSITAQRCTAYPGTLTMCLPDFDPVFNYLVSGYRSLGRMADNWINVASIIAQKSIGFDAPECAPQSAQLTAANASFGLFGANRTAVVGLTPGLYAVTDGVHVQYFNHYSNVESVLVPHAWPIPVGRNRWCNIKIISPK